METKESKQTVKVNKAEHIPVSNLTIPGRIISVYILRNQNTILKINSAYS